jgi:putative membrane protein insertion efficiency factor
MMFAQVRASSTKTLLGAIAGYRSIVSPWLPARCRFEPSCSAYAAEAIARHGPLAGSRLAVARIARCHPWHPGGHDPVPALATPPHGD